MPTAYALLLLREGRFDESSDLVSAAVSSTGGSTEWITPVYDAFRDPEKIPLALDAIDLASAEGRLTPRIEITVRTMFGDLDGAMLVGRSLEEPGEAFETEVLFLPELLPLRQHPEFLDLMMKIGVQEYWDDAGCIWSAAAVRCPDLL